LTLFPDLKGEADPGWSARTIEELLLCQAGMQANLDRAAMEKGWLDTRPLTEQRSDAVRRAMQPAPKRAGKFLYSNLGYMVIGAAIDRITGTSFEDALEHYVLRPLGITTLGYGAPPKIWGHSSRWRFRNVVLGQGKAMDPTDARSDNPAVMSSAGTLHVTMADWAKFLHLFITNGDDLLSKETIEHLLTAPTGSRMSKGWASADRLPGVSHGVQGSNTMWAAAALLNKPRDRASLVACNDGRTRIVSQTAVLAMRLLKQA
jgi:CubicO group peptidase (beta-lactamase class C family)